MRARIAALALAIAMAGLLPACGDSKKLASPRAGLITTIVGIPSFDRVTSLLIGPDGSIYVAGRGGANVYPAEGEGRPLYRTTHRFMEIRGIALGENLVYLSDFDDRTVKAITANGGVRNVAGNGDFAIPENGAVAASSPLTCPTALLYDTESAELVIRQGVDVYTLNAKGTIQQRSGLMGRSAEEQCKPRVIGHLEDESGNEYFARETFVVKNLGDAFYPDGGPKASPRVFDAISAIAYDPTTNSIYVADRTRIKRISLPDGTISTVAGTGSDDASESDGPLMETDLGEVQAIAVDGRGNVYFAAGYPPMIRAFGAPGAR